jgi:hypothetical protein
LSGDANPTKAIAATKLDKVIENSEYAKILPRDRERPRVKAAYLYKTSVQIKGEKKTIGMVVHEREDGKKYYDHFEAKDGSG